MLQTLKKDKVSAEVREFISEFKFFKGIVRNKDTVLFLTLDQSGVICVPLGWQREEVKRWAMGEPLKRKDIVACQLFGEKRNKCLALFSNGNYQFVTDESIPLHAITKSRVFTGLNLIDGGYFACGMGPIVYRFKDDESWESLFSDQESKHECDGFQSIDGFSQTDLYAVGWNRTIGHFNGQKWQMEYAPIRTPFILTSVHCGSQGIVHVAGLKGTFLRGTFGKWQDHSSIEVTEDLWSVIEFQGRIFASSLYSIYELKKGGLKKIEFDGKVKSAGQLSAHDGLLCSIGESDVLLFDGKEWTRLI